MQKDLQLIIWQYILAHKQATGEPISYIDFSRDAKYRAEILARAKVSKNQNLLRLANKVEQGFVAAQKQYKPQPIPEDDFEGASESLLLSEAPPEVWAGTAHPAAEEHATEPHNNSPQDETEPPRERYARRLRGALNRQEFSLLHRRALDRFAKKHGISSGEIIAIENEVRSRLKLPALRWDEELNSVIQDLATTQSSLSNLRSQLQHTYVRDGRLDEQAFEQLYKHPSSLQADAQQPTAKVTDSPTDKKSPIAWIVGGLVLLGLLIGLLTIL